MFDNLDYDRAYDERNEDVRGSIFQKIWFVAVISIFIILSILCGYFSYKKINLMIDEKTVHSGSILIYVDLGISVLFVGVLLFLAVLIFSFCTILKPGKNFFFINFFYIIFFYIIFSL